MNKNVFILGQGYFAQEIHHAFGWPILNQRIQTFKDIDHIIARHKPKALINCIGYTGKRNVDDCELDRDKTLQANTFVPILLGEAAFRHRIKLVHLSSGCIYHYDYKKNKPISETIVPDYYDLYYSRSKIYTEHILQELSQRTNILIARVRVPLDNKPHPKNILTKLLSFKHIIDLPNSITYVPDFLKALKHLMSINATGTYNVCTKGALCYSELLNIYKQHVPDFQYKLINLKQLKMNRTNLVMSTAKLSRSGFKVRSTQSILKECVKNYLTYL